MPLNTIPVLSEDYPLFDWSEHQSSRDALVKGTPTKQFAKEAWNAIVDDLDAALSAAGIAWDSTYTTAEGARITTSPGKLTAAAFNSVRLNIDRPAPLGWQWAWNENFRGYLGREEFRGVSTHGKARDKVYPEYIIELARKLNLLLEIMRGTALLADAEAAYVASVIVRAEAFSRPSLPADVPHISSVHTSVEGTSAPGAPAEVQRRSGTRISADADADVAAPGYAYHNVPLLLRAEGNARKALPMEPNPQLSGTQIHAEMESTKCIEASVELITGSKSYVEVEQLPPLPIEAGGVSHTCCEAEATQCEALPMETGAVSYSRAKAELVQKEPIPMEAKTLSSTKVTADMAQAKPIDAEAARLIRTLTYCKVDSAWYPPIWVNGGLWIRQSHSVTQNENGELVIT